MILNDLNLRIIDEFLGDYSKEITGSGVARKKNLNQKSAANALSSLESEGFLKSRTEGKNRLFSLNLENQSIADFLSAAEHLKKISFLKKKTLLRGTIEKVLPFCKGAVIIFGSYAKGKEKEGSDLDLFVIGEYDAKKIGEISEAQGIEINVKCYSRNIFEKGLDNHDFLLEEIIKDHISLRGCEDFILILLRRRYGQNRVVP
ncbi:MAG: nucleotidyltransferase domain-containing protein [archaeon]